MTDLETAFGLANAQLARLVSGDIEGFLASEDAYTAACEAAAAVAPDAEALATLLATVAAIGRHATAIGDEASTEMAALSGRRAALTAYTRSAA